MKRLYFNGPILTMEDTPYTEAVLTENGRIIALGQDALNGDSVGVEKHDLGGAALLPAFVDAHGHFTQTAVSLLQADVSGAKTPEEVCKTIADFVQNNALKPGEWVTARGLSCRCPTLRALDAAAPDHSVILQDQSGHGGMFNSLGLQKLEITPELKAPEGGRIEMQDGHLTGYLEENAYFFFVKQIPMPKTEDLSRAFLDAQQLYASYGIAAAQDGMLTAEMLPLYQLLLGGDLLRMDVLGYAELAAYDAFAAALPNSVRGYDRHFRLAGLKIFLDGSPQGRTAWMLHPYQGEDEYCGYGVMKEDAVLTALALSAKKQVQLLAHCNGDAAVNQFLTCLAKAEAAHGNLRGLRPVIIHAQLITSEQLAWAARLSAIPSFFIAHVYHFGDTHIKNFGRNRAEGISPAKAALDLGLPFTFHQDVPVIPPNMLETVWCAAVRHTSGGETLGQPIPVLDALKAVTLNAAHQCFEENARGSLKVGKKADFVLLDHDPLAVDPERIREIKVLSLENGCADEPDSR